MPKKSPRQTLRGFLYRTKRPEINRCPAPFAKKSNLTDGTGKNFIKTLLVFNNFPQQFHNKPADADRPDKLRELPILHERNRICDSAIFSEDRV